MLDKIVLSQDRKTAVIVFDTHSVTISSDEPNVMLLVYDIIIEPSQQNAAYHAEMDRRYQNSLEDTVKIHVDDIKDVA